MTTQEQIRLAAAKRNLNLTDAQVNRIAGTLRYSRLRTASNLDPIIQKELTRLVDKIRTQHPSTIATEATAAEAPTTRDATFKQIDDSLANGNCPRCGKKMRDVLLADYTPALFCEGECRITLWAQAGNQAGNQAAEQGAQ